MNKATMPSILGIATHAAVGESAGRQGHVLFGHLAQQVDILAIVGTIAVQVIHPSVIIRVYLQIHGVTVDVPAIRHIADTLIVPGGAIAADDTEGLCRVTRLVH